MTADLQKEVLAMDEQAFYKVTYGLYVVSAEADGGRSGCIVRAIPFGIPAQRRSLPAHDSRHDASYQQQAYVLRTFLFRPFQKKRAVNIST